MILFKEIKIQPSEWYLDVIVSKNIQSTNKFCKQRYGIDDYWDGKTECATVQSDKDSELNGHKRLVIVIESLNDKGVIVHELIHALWHVSKAIGYEMNYESQEWQAILYEYLFKEVIDRKNYVKIN